MDLKLSSPILEIPRVGPTKAAYLQKLGINYARDFLYTFPRRYDDFSNITEIRDLVVGETMTVHGRVKTVKQNWGFRGRRRLLRIFVDIEDDTGIIAITWFNLRFLPKQLWQGREIFVAGQVELNSAQQKLGERGKNLPKFRMRSPVIEFSGDDDHTHTARITPIYPETYGITSRFLRYQVKSLLPLVSAVPEYMPDDIRERNNLMGIQHAIRETHFPSNTQELAKAQRRLHFDELFFLQLAALVRRSQRRALEAHQIERDKIIADDFLSSLSFSLTGAQQEAINEVTDDLAMAMPMNRLLQGDVGSGKSVVALFAAYVTLRAGFSVVYLAPTEILARQQADSFKELLGNQVELLIGAQSVGEKRRVKERLAGKEPFCVVGTHALLQADVRVHNFALAIIDEQHRFGVAQRKKLQAAGKGRKVPHLLSMTATPIPRTLNLTVYGDLDVSVLREMPPGRKPISTSLVKPKKRDKAIIHILQELHRGRQGFVIAPLIDPPSLQFQRAGKSEVKSAKETEAEMKKLFPDVAIGLLHGQMSSEDKESVMRNFAAGALQLLVATAVVEVGVNVPNATVMIIEGAERFGLAQLHQFRGRIGRGEHKSYCYLFPTTEEAAGTKRLRVLEHTADGFVIAQEDLKLRGPGEIYGVAQSGYGDLKVASLLDYDMIKLTRVEADQLLSDDPGLVKHDILRRKVEQKNLLVHFE